MPYKPVSVKVWGEFAAFVRPELKAERVSYPCMTPSAARGILESIFWKPEFHWRIREIHILRPVPSRFPVAVLRQENTPPTSFYRSFSILRNEVDRRATETPISITESRTQRHSLILRDVCYAIYADVEVRPGVQEDAAKYRDQFQRRVARGQCHAMPYLGCGEFSCFFAPLDGSEEVLIENEEPIDLGLMLFDIAHRADGGSVPLFFQAMLEKGVLKVDPAHYGRIDA